MLAASVAPGWLNVVNDEFYLTGSAVFHPVCGVPMKTFYFSLVSAGPTQLTKDPRLRKTDFVQVSGSFIVYCHVYQWCQSTFAVN
jgi:hypothetical protein